MELETNDEIGSYRIVRRLGAGGMAAVYEVEHVKLGVRYALKTFTLDHGDVELYRKRFSVEGKLLARLSHPNLVRVFDLDLDERRGLLYFVMDLVMGPDGRPKTLADVRPGSVGEPQLCAWFAELCDALDYVHRQGIVHRDIKLNNILVNAENHVVLSDFGVSRVFDETLRGDVNVERTMVDGTEGSTYRPMGTFGYMAPEVMSGREPKPSADVYSLGVTFFQLLTGVKYAPFLSARPEDGSGSDTATTLLSSFEYRWIDVLPAMLKQSEAERPTDLMALSQALEPKPAHPAWRRPATVAASVVALLAAGAFFLGRPERRGVVPTTSVATVAAPAAATNAAPSTVAAVECDFAAEGGPCDPPELTAGYLTDVPQAAPD